MATKQGKTIQFIHPLFVVVFGSGMEKTSWCEIRNTVVLFILLALPGSFSRDAQPEGDPWPPDQGAAQGTQEIP